jgi:ribosomal protein L37AE/L43A
MDLKQEEIPNFKEAYQEGINKAIARQVLDRMTDRITCPQCGNRKVIRFNSLSVRDYQCAGCGNIWSMK